MTCRKETQLNVTQPQTSFVVFPNFFSMVNWVCLQRQ